MSDLSPRPPDLPDAEYASYSPQPFAQRGNGAPSYEVLPPVPVSAMQAYTPSPMTRDALRAHISWWEAPYVFFITFIIFALLTPRIATYLNPTTGDEPFYLMTAISIWNDHDLNECNNYRQRDEARLYPVSVVADRQLPFGWVGWNAAPYPLPPHPARIEPPTRRCFGTDTGGPQRAIPDASFPLPANGTESELYSKHGLGLALLVTVPYMLGDRLLVVFFLNVLGALLAANIYLFARQGTGKVLPALLTWAAFSFTVPIMPYSFLIFPELPAALLVIYAFRRIWLGRNNTVQLLAIGLCMAFLPWLHYRFIPVSAGLAIFFMWRLFKDRRQSLDNRLRDMSFVVAPNLVSAVWLMAYFYFLYRQPYPNGSDHAGISDVAGTLRGAVGSFIDQQWGLFVASPIFILVIVGVVLMALSRQRRYDLLWIGVVFVPYFILIANYAQWWGEWCPPARYLTSVLPLLALPFAFALDYIRGFAYKAIYGVLMLASLAVTYAFMFQPQWMYSQPDGRSVLFVNGLSGALKSIPATAGYAGQVTDFFVHFFPTFVVPYFAYISRGKAVGDQWVSLAWERSVFIGLIILVIVLLSLFFAYLRWHRNEDGPPSDGYPGEAKQETVALNARPAGQEAAPSAPVTFSSVPVDPAWRAARVWIHLRNATIVHLRASPGVK